MKLALLLSLFLLASPALADRVRILATDRQAAEARVERVLDARRYPEGAAEPYPGVPAEEDLEAGVAAVVGAGGAGAALSAEAPESLYYRRT